MKKTIMAALVGMLLMLSGATAAYAGGSDAPTPYHVTTEGIQLPNGRVFEAHGHVNVRWVNENLREQPAVNIHFDPNNNHPGGAWIGKNFIPWSAFGIPAGASVIWVQVHGFNEHFGENGQKSMPVQPAPTVKSETRENSETTEWAEVSFDCVAGESIWERTTTNVTEVRDTVISWDPMAMWWAENWSDWTARASSQDVERDTRSFDPETRPECRVEMPATGPGGVAALVGLGALLTVGGALTLRTRTTA